VSNYINHHQIPFCEAMCRETDSQFFFLQTEPMEAERVRMGWQEENNLSYLKLFYREPEECKRLVLESDVVLFGGCDDESYIAERLWLGRPVVRLSERLYKTGQYKAVSPRGLIRKYQDHTRYRKAQVYLLCSGAYVSSDFHLVRAYPDKMFRWGYFPETRSYHPDKLMEGKKKEIPAILWAGRFLDWKHPELPLKTAQWLKEKGCLFHLDIIGGGEMEQEVQEMIREYDLADRVSLQGYKSPGEVRVYMEKADIFLATGDRREGWGAVINEAMNSGCAVVADHMIGAAPYLINHGINGLVYQDGKAEQLFRFTEKLIRDADYLEILGRKAYETIASEWNAENGAACLMELLEELSLLPTGTGKRNREPVRTQAGPCSPAPVISERKMYRYLTGGK